jgi:hypothetical protein
LVFNLFALNVLSDERQVPDDTLRFFLRLVRDWDLSRFRAISRDRATESCWVSEPDYNRHMAALVRLGLLVAGPAVPSVAKDGTPAPILLYRIPARYLLPRSELQLWAREIRAQEQRAQIAPVAAQAG